MHMLCNATLQQQDALNSSIFICNLCTYVKYRCIYTVTEILLLYSEQVSKVFQGIRPPTTRGEVTQNSLITKVYNYVYVEINYDKKISQKKLEVALLDIMMQWHNFKINNF